jgi:hypothetical protein
VDMPQPPHHLPAQSMLLFAKTSKMAGLSHFAICERAVLECLLKPSCVATDVCAARSAVINTRCWNQHPLHIAHLRN